EPSEVSLAGAIPAPPPAVDFDPAYVKRLAGLDLPADRIRTILEALGFEYQGARVQPPTWRRDVEGKADLVVHQPRGGRGVRRRRRDAGAGEPDLRRARLHAPLDPAGPHRGRRPQRA